MKNKIIYTLIAGLAIGFIPMTSASADDEVKYYKVLSAQTALPVKPDIVPMQRVLTFPVVVEKTTATTTTINGQTRQVLIQETTPLPVVLERTTTVKPHRFLSFGVWH